jgi:SAM-dependent methyltransferase
VTVDFGRTASDYGRFRAGFPDELFERLRAFDVGLPGQRVLDVGTGTGTLARGFARRGCMVTGLDPSESMLAQARRLSDEEGVNVTYVTGTAEATGLPSTSFDAVTAGQCWHWFEKAAAAEELMQVLIPGGRLVIAHYDWLPLPDNVVDATEQLILKHNPSWQFSGRGGIHPEFVRDVAVAGFSDIETFSFDVPAPYSHEAWRGRIRASAGVAASLAPDAVARFDAELAALLRARFPEDPVITPHRCWAIVCRRPQG